MIERSAAITRPLLFRAGDPRHLRPLGVRLENHEELVDGLLNTLKVSAFGIAGAFLIGAVLGAARAHRIPVVSQITAVYVEVIRNTPILVQIFMIFMRCRSSASSSTSSRSPGSR